MSREKPKVKTKIFSVVLAFMLVTTFAVSNAFGEDVLEGVQKSGKIRMAIYLKSASPLQRANEDTGEAEGYMPDLGRLMAKDLGVEAEFVDTEWKAIIPALISGKVDMIISAPSATPERALSIDFPANVISYNVSVLVHKDGKVKSLADLKKPGIKISVSQGSTQHFFAVNNYPNAKIKPADGIMEARLEVASKRSDASIVDSYQAIKFAREYAQTKVLRDAAGKVLVLSREPGSLAIRQGDPRFYKWLQNWTRWYREQGILDALYNKWMGSVFDE